MQMASPSMIGGLEAAASSGVLAIALTAAQLPFAGTDAQREELAVVFTDDDLMPHIFNAVACAGDRRVVDLNAGMHTTWLCAMLVLLGLGATHKPKKMSGNEVGSFG